MVKFTTPTSTNIGIRLENFIRSKGWTKKEFAARMGIDPANVSKYLSGKLDVQRLSASLIKEGCDLRTIFYGDELTLSSPSRELLKSFRERLPIEFPRAIGKLLDPESELAEAFERVGLIGFCVQVGNNVSKEMTPMVKKGDRVLLSVKEKPRDGDLVAAFWGEKNATLRLYHAEGRNVILRPLSQRLPPKVIDSKEVLLLRVALIRKR